MESKVLRERNLGISSSRDSHIQLITLVVDPWRARGDEDPAPPALIGVRGVQTVQPDPMSDRVWVFGNGGVEPETLIDTLESWGYGAYVVDTQFAVPA